VPVPGQKPLGVVTRLGAERLPLPPLVMFAGPPLVAVGHQEPDAADRRGDRQLGFFRVQERDIVTAGKGERLFDSPQAVYCERIVRLGVHWTPVGLIVVAWNRGNGQVCPCPREFQHGLRHKMTENLKLIGQCQVVVTDVLSTLTHNALDAVAKEGDQHSSGGILVVATDSSLQRADVSSNDSFGPIAVRLSELEIADGKDRHFGSGILHAFPWLYLLLDQLDQIIDIHPVSLSCLLAEVELP